MKGGSALLPLMQDWNNLRVLLAIIDSGTLREAGRRLKISTATVSRRLAALEEELDVVLIERGPAGLRVTELAHAMVKPLREAEDALGRARMLTKQGDEIRGAVKVACLPLVGRELVCPALPDLLAAHPDLRVDLALHYDVVNLGRGDADIAIRTARPDQQNLVVKRIPASPTIPVVHRELLERMGAEDLPWLGWPEHIQVEEARWLETHVNANRIVLRVDDMHAHAAACMDGLGATLLPGPALKRAPDLVRVPGMPNGPGDSMWLAAPEAVRQLPRVDTVWRFLDALLQQVSE